MDSARTPPTNHPVRHDLKTWPKSFASILSGFKKHEIRVNDRDFRAESSRWAMNQCWPDDGGSMGMSPGGNTSGTLTLITCRGTILPSTHVVNPSQVP